MAREFSCLLKVLLSLISLSERFPFLNGWWRAQVDRRWFQSTQVALRELSGCLDIVETTPLSRKTGTFRR